MTFQVTQGHWLWCCTTGNIWLPVSVSLKLPHTDKMFDDILAILTVHKHTMETHR